MHWAIKSLGTVKKHVALQVSQNLAVDELWHILSHFQHVTKLNNIVETNDGAN